MRHSSTISSPWPCARPLPARSSGTPASLASRSRPFRRCALPCFGLRLRGCSAVWQADADHDLESIAPAVKERPALSKSLHGTRTRHGEHRPLVALQPFISRRCDPGQPFTVRGFADGLGAGEAYHRASQNVQVMHLAKQALQPLQVALPDALLLRQKTFEGIAESFELHARLMATRSAARPTAPGIQGTYLV